MISRTRIRAFIAGVFAITVLLVFAAFVTASQGINVPGLNIIANMLGFGG